MAISAIKFIDGHCKAFPKLLGIQIQKKSLTVKRIYKDSQIMGCLLFSG